MSSSNPTLPTSSFIGNDDWRWWLGTVLNADDKEAKLGRVKVNILGYHRPKEQPEDLPWAMVMAPTDSAGANGVGSAPNSLKPGSFVVGFFLDYPDCQQPVVIGTLLSKIKDVQDSNSQDRWDFPGSFENSVNKIKSDVTDRGASEAALNNTASMSAAAAASPHSAANPSGVLKDVPVADGKSGADKNLFENFSYATSYAVNTVTQLNSIANSTTTLSEDIDSEVQTIPVVDASKFPDKGVLIIGGEIVGYNNRKTKAFTLAKRGFDNTSAKRHKKGTTVTLIPKGEYLGGSRGTSKQGDAVGTFTNNLVDVKGVVDNVLDYIENTLWWTVNQVKSFLMGQITKILNSIGIAAISPIPFFGKLLTDTIVFIIKEIACILDESLMDALMSGIRSAIFEFINGALSVVDGIRCITDAIFGSVFQLVELGNQIFSLVNSVVSTLSSLGDIKNITSLSSASVTSILDFVFGLLGIGCNRDTRDPFGITFSSCKIADLGSCSGPSFDISIKGVKGKYNPAYSKIIGTFSETGTMVMMDDTPYNSRLVIEHGPSKSGIHIYDNGDVRISNASTKTEVTIKDQEIVVHGNVKMTVDGNYNLKVGKDYHLEVAGMYNLSVHRESKINYAGEHNCYFKNDARLESNNGLALVSSKLGITCSGQYDLISPIISTAGTEQNHISTGSWNLFSMFENEFIAASAFKLTGLSNIDIGSGTNTNVFAGAHIEATGGSWSGFKLGNANQTTIGAETDFWAAMKTMNVLGIDTENKLSVEIENTSGVRLTNVTGADIETDVGFKGEITGGLRCTASGGLTLHT